jgi:hypothetical protein
MSLFAKLKRRKVFRVGIAYAVAAWVLLQVLDVVGEILELPAWGGGLILVLLVIGFFLALVFAWAYELTPEGVKRDSEVDHSRPAALQTGRRLNRLIIATLILALTLFAADKIEHTDRRRIELCYLAIGDQDKALAAIETRAAHGHNAQWWFMHKVPRYELLWGEPRFEAVLQKIRDDLVNQRANLARMETAYIP